MVLEPLVPVSTSLLAEAVVDRVRSLKESSICVVDASGKIMRETKVAREPETLVAFFRRLGLPMARINLEAGPLSQWLHAGLTQAGFDVVLLETRQVKAALSAMVVKTDGVDGPVGIIVPRRRLSRSQRRPIVLG